jgi:hypothetical protein
MPSLNAAKIEARRFRDIDDIDLYWPLPDVLPIAYHADRYSEFKGRPVIL